MQDPVDVIGRDAVRGGRVPVCEWLGEASPFASQGGKVKGVRLLIHPARLDVQVLEYVHLSFKADLKYTNNFTFSNKYVSVCIKIINKIRHSK